MPNLPPIDHRHRIGVICEGNEDYAYFERLTQLHVWDAQYESCLINAKSASNIPARYQHDFQNNRYELLLVFCDTDKAPYREYQQIKQKINRFHDSCAADHAIIFANPCTMQIILAHFGDATLKNQSKKTNASVIAQLTGIANYDAHDTQIRAVCQQIFHKSYPDMKVRVQAMNRPDTEPGSTNFGVFLDRFEQSDDRWIAQLTRMIMGDE